MGASKQSHFFFDESFGEKEDNKELNEDVENLLAMFRLMSIEDKIAAKRMINIEKLF